MGETAAVRAMLDKDTASLPHLAILGEADHVDVDARASLVHDPSPSGYPLWDAPSPSARLPLAGPLLLTL
jgi:hypothetical protein